MRSRLARAMPLLLLAGLITIVPASRVTPRAHALQLDDFTKLQRRLLSGLAFTTLSDRQAAAAQAAQEAQVERAGARPVGANDDYFPNRDGDCPDRLGDNVKVNQNCLNLSDPDLAGRGQANNETFIALDPRNPDHLLASDNDYRLGDSGCGTSYSLNGGRDWSDSLLPSGFIRGTAFGTPREYWQAGGDTSVAFDSKGNAYLSCLVFQRGAATSPNRDASRALLLFRSTGNAGASWNFTGRITQLTPDPNATSGLTLDKQLMTVDTSAGSPFQDRIYVTWTEFSSDGTAYIWGSFSSDYGETFSPRVLVSSTSAACENTFGLPTPQGTCNLNQFSQPFTGPDGTLYVAWANANRANTGSDNRSQILLARSTNGGASFSAPVRVGDYYDLPDCATFQSGRGAGSACVPEKGATANSFFRASNYPSGGVNPRNPRQVVVTFASYINRHSNEANGCTPAGFSPRTGQSLYTGVKTPGACNNDILVSTSNDAGASFTGTATDPRQLTSVTSTRGQATSDQWFQWAAFTRDGRLAVSYYDRQYGDDELTGFSDFSLSGSRNLRDFATRRVTSSSMPPPTQFEGTFWGDYTGLAAHDTAFPIWSDTRHRALFLCAGTARPGVPPQLCEAPAPNAAVANDQTMFTAEVGVPTP